MSELEQELHKMKLEIARLLGMDVENLLFEFHRESEKTKLDLITINPRHQQSFLFHSVYGFGEIDVMHKMLDYVQNHRQTKNSYTIQWSIGEGGELHTSYFRGKNIYEVLDKFYFGKDINSTVIFNVSLNPLS